MSGPSQAADKAKAQRSAGLAENALQSEAVANDNSPAPPIVVLRSEGDSAHFYRVLASVLVRRELMSINEAREAENEAIPHAT